MKTNRFFFCKENGTINAITFHIEKLQFVFLNSIGRNCICHLYEVRYYFFTILMNVYILYTFSTHRIFYTFCSIDNKSIFSLVQPFDIFLTSFLSFLATKTHFLCPTKQNKKTAAQNSATYLNWRA